MSPGYKWVLLSESNGRVLDQVFTTWMFKIHN